MINADIIAQLKDQVDLDLLFKSYGLTIKKNGKGYVTQCPFHKDDTPSLSITPKKKLWQCFGCGESGDVISFIQKMDNISFTNAAKKLANMHGVSLDDLTIKDQKVLTDKPTLTISSLTIPKDKNNKIKTKPSNPSPFSDEEILTKVTRYYHNIFETQPQGKAYLKTRGITKKDIFTHHSIGYVNGTLLQVLPKEDGVYDQLIELGILLAPKGTSPPKERFHNCVVFPLLDENGKTRSVYGRHTKMETSGHFYLPGNRSGLFNHTQLKEKVLTSGPIEQLIITESIIDALSFIEVGIENVLPLYGTNGFTKAHETLLTELQPKEIILALDGDEQGKKAAQALKDRLSNLFSFNCHIVTFPNTQDANDYFKSHSKNHFEVLLSHSETQQKPISLAIQTHKAVKRKTTPSETPPAKALTKEEPQDIENTCTKYFHIKWAELKGNRLAVTLKAQNTQTGRFLLDTFNLYSQRDRDKLSKKASTLFGIKQPQLDREILNWIPIVETRAKDFKASTRDPISIDNDTHSTPTMNDAQEQAALAFLKSPTLFDDLVNDYEQLGYIGESMNKKLAYLVMTSRKMANPLSLVIMSNSAAGKSSLQKATMDLCPPEDGKHFTRLTQQSLYYLGEESIKHKFLSIEEEEGSSEANYSIKTLLSSKQLTVAATIQDPQTGKKKAEEYTTKGPLALMMSTTSPEIESELESRVMIMTIDESDQQTGNIHEGQRHRRTLAGRTQSQQQDAIQHKHHNSQRLLRSGLQIINNYAPQLTFPYDRLRHRRGHDHYLDLIDSVAFLRQHQKVLRNCDKLGHYIEVDKTDIDIANTIFVQVLGWTIDELGPPTRRLLKQIVDYSNTHHTKEFTAKQIRDAFKWGHTHLHNHLKKLEELEYLISMTGKQGSKYTYRLIYQGDGQNSQRFITGLKSVDELTDVEGLQI